MNSTQDVSTVAFKAVAPTSRQALRLLREHMGSEALIVSNRMTSQGVEILATLEEQFARMIAPPRPLPMPPVALPESVGRDDPVVREIQSMRGMIETRLAGLAWNEQKGRDPLRGQLLQVLLDLGFSARFAKDMLGALPVGHELGSGMDYIRAELSRQLPVLESESNLMDEGGVYALMGPTGVGKTTTTAKLAARCVMRFGARKLALVTTDTYRIGAYEQLRIYGQILGVAVHAVKDAGDLERALQDLADKHMVLIDTVGMSQRDRAVSQQIAMLSGAMRPVKRLLLLNATSHGDTLDEVVRAYQGSGASAQGSELAGCIFTKVDEATHPGVLLDTAIRHRLPVHYVCNGQKVPEDLMSVESNALIAQFLQPKRSDALFIPAETDLPEVNAEAAPVPPGDDLKPKKPATARKPRRSQTC